jgi:hypothetical protein
MATLETEVRTYETLLPTLQAEQGKFAVITGDDLLGTFESYEDALKIGYQHCGMTPFLVKRISVEEAVSYFSRDFARPCQA